MGRYAHQTEDYERLRQDVEMQRLAGLIFVQHPYPLGRMPPDYAGGFAARDL